MPGAEGQHLLVVAGEASGDEWAAPVVGQLGVRAFGLGGSRLAKAGCDLLANASQVSAMGLFPALLRAPRVVSVGASLLGEARRRRPRVALLVGYSEFNGWLGARLRTMGVRVLWFAPPQVWAWRRGRARRYATACDRMAVLLPFEQQLWRDVGADAHFVGHPAAAEVFDPREQARRQLDARPGELAIALLPGSRPSEVRRHLGPMLEAARQLRTTHRARAWVLLANELHPTLIQHVRECATRAGADCLDPASNRLLGGFDAALVKSGTGSLKCALAGAAPVIVYRTSRLTEFALKRMLSVSFIGLPNLVLGRQEFPELAGAQVTAAKMARELGHLVSNRNRFAQARRELSSSLVPPDARSPEDHPAQRVARLMDPWLA